jgi:hypothetical protein
MLLTSNADFLGALVSVQRDWGRHLNPIGADANLPTLGGKV